MNMTITRVLGFFAVVTPCIVLGACAAATNTVAAAQTIGVVTSARSSDFPESFTGPSGHPAFLAHCGGSPADVGCYEEALKRCPNGYLPVDHIDATSGGDSIHYFAYECK
jgi:hypothetical protein